MYNTARFLFRAAAFCMLSFFFAYSQEHAPEDEDPGILIFNTHVQNVMVILY